MNTGDNLYGSSCSTNSSNYNNNLYNEHSSSNFGPIPISPHVNVPNNTHSFKPPPLPPRRKERREFEAAFSAQNRQAPDAPQVSALFVLNYIELYRIDVPYLSYLLSFIAYCINRITRVKLKKNDVFKNFFLRSTFSVLM